MVAMLAIDGQTRIASSRRPTRGLRVDIRVAPRPSQIRDAAARANAGAWLGPGTHPGSLGEHKARDTLCSKPAACPAPPGAQQGQLDLTACDRYGARRVSRAAQGGTGLWCRPIVCGGGPPSKARTSCPGCACACSCGANHGTVS